MKWVFIIGFNTSTVSVESILDNAVYELLEFQYFNCIGGIHIPFYQVDLFGCFNTSTVSVESTFAGLYKIVNSPFQYFNCIGGICVKFAREDVVKSFQYFNCIGGIEFHSF